MDKKQQEGETSSKPKKVYKFPHSTKPLFFLQEVARVIRVEDVDRLEWLFHKFHLNLHTNQLSNGNTPLNVASWGYPKSVELLLFWGADVNWEDGCGNRPIQSVQQNEAECLDLLIFNVDRSLRDYQRKLILNTDAWKGRGEPIKYNVPYNHFRGDVDARDGYGGWTPLHFFACLNGIDAMHYLINLGADIEAKDRWIQTPMHVAASSYPPQQQAIFHLFFEGADINARNELKQTPIDLTRKILIVDDENDVEERKEIVALLEFLKDKKRHDSLHAYVDLLCYHDYLLDLYTTYFLNKLKRDTDDLVSRSRLYENKDYVDEWFEDEEFEDEFFENEDY